MFISPVGGHHFKDTHVYKKVLFCCYLGAAMLNTIAGIFKTKHEYIRALS